MLTPGKIWPGSQVDITVAFRDGNGDPMDPDSITFKLMSPERRETSYTYGIGETISKQSVGNYTARITPDKAGRWHFRWESTGEGTTIASEGDILVQRSPFVDDPGAYRDYR